MDEKERKEAKQRKGEKERERKRKTNFKRCVYIKMVNFAKLNFHFNQRKINSSYDKNFKHYYYLLLQ